MSGTIKTATVLGAVFLLIAGTILLSSCSEDCPTGPVQPKPYNGWLYATDINSNYVYRIDTEADTLVDSMRCELGDLYMPARVVSSSDGRYLAISFGDNWNEKYVLRLYDAQTWELISELSDPANPLFFIENNTMLLTRVGEEFVYYSIPGLARVDSDSMIFAHPNLFRLDMLEIDERKKLAYIIARFDREESIYENYSDSVCLYAYDYANRLIEDEWIINIRDDNNDFYGIGRAALNVGRSYFYALTASYSDSAAYVVGYDYANDDLIFKFETESGLGDIALSPNGQDVYVVDPGQPGDIWTAGTLYIFDANNGAYTHGISLYGYAPNRPDIPMFASVIEFTPTGDKAYIGSGLNGKHSGTICSINTSTYSVENLVWSDFEHVILFLEIGPK